WAIAWFNPENPRTCGVTDEQGENPIVVEIEIDVPCHEAPAEIISKAHAQNAAMNRAGRERYGRVQQIFKTDFEKRRFRSVVSDGIAREREAEFKRQTEEIASKEREVASVQKQLRRSGIVIPKDDPRFESRARGAQALRELEIFDNQSEEKS